MKIFVGTAGWNLPLQLKNLFPGTESHLVRYAQVFNGVEINSSFNRDHLPETYAKWSALVPLHFRFSVKLSKYFTLEKRLQIDGSRLRECLLAYGELKEKWGVLLIQLPPSLIFEHQVAEKFIRTLRQNFTGNTVWEPRHPTWSSTSALKLLADYKISKVLADPEPCIISKSQRPQVESLRYLRLHGRPQIYKSSYSETLIARISESIINPISFVTETWCIFDNTAYGFATDNALLLKSTL